MASPPSAPAGSSRPRGRTRASTSAQPTDSARWTGTAAASSGTRAGLARQQQRAGGAGALQHVLARGRAPPRVDGRAARRRRRRGPRGPRRRSAPAQRRSRPCARATRATTSRMPERPRPSLDGVRELLRNPPESEPDPQPATPRISDGPSDIRDGVATTRIDLDGEGRFQTLRRELGVSAFGLNLLRYRPRPAQPDPPPRAPGGGLRRARGDALARHGPDDERTLERGERRARRPGRAPAAHEPGRRAARRPRHRRRRAARGARRRGLRGVGGRGGPLAAGGPAAAGPAERAMPGGLPPSCVGSPPEDRRRSHTVRTSQALDTGTRSPRAGRPLAHAARGRRPEAPRRPASPTAAPATARGERDVDPHDLGGQLEQRTGCRPRRPGRPSSTHATVIARRTSRSAPAARSSNQTATAATPEHARDPPVLVDRPVERVGAPPLQPVDLVARAGAAGVRAGRRRRGADEDRERAERQQRAHRPDAEPVGRARALARLVARAPGERGGGDQDQHREREVAHDEAGREVVADGEAAEHRLADHAERQQHADQREIAPVRAAAERQQARRRPRRGPRGRTACRLPNSINACVSSGGATLP